MEFKGTKGKWIYHGRGIILNENYILNKDDKKIHIRCEMLPLEKYSKIENEHNALLISKAPEMLEMLQKLISHYEDVMNSDYSPFALRSDIDNAKELIKQATKL